MALALAMASAMALAVALLVALALALAVALELAKLPWALAGPDGCNVGKGIAGSGPPTDWVTGPVLKNEVRLRQIKMWYKYTQA